MYMEVNLALRKPALLGCRACQFPGVFTDKRFARALVLPGSPSKCIFVSGCTRHGGWQGRQRCLAPKACMALLTCCSSIDNVVALAVENQTVYHT